MMSKFKASGYAFLKQIDEFTEVLENKFTGTLLLVHYPEETFEHINVNCFNYCKM